MNRTPVARRHLGRGAHVALWALRIFAIALAAMVLYTFASQVA